MGQITDGRTSPQEHEILQLFENHHEMQKLYRNDATVHSWLTIARHGNCTLQEALVAMVIQLGQEKQRCHAENDRLHSLSMSKPTIIKKGGLS